MGTSTATKVKEEDNLLYFQVEGYDKLDVTKRGQLKVKVNEEQIALIAIGDKIFAIQDKCPHYGGPLHQGDIEDLPELNLYCIRCPWHSWKFDLTTGKCLSPTDRDTKDTKVYPVKIDEKTNTISLGFESFASTYFKELPE